MIAERREIEDPNRNQRDHADIDQHADHQPLVHDRKHLPPLSNETKPVGPRDEGRRMRVH